MGTLVGGLSSLSPPLPVDPVLTPTPSTLGLHRHFDVWVRGPRPSRDRNLSQVELVHGFCVVDPLGTDPVD